MAIKILMNAEYGALANRYCRYFDIKLASAITFTGQLVIQWIEKYLEENLNSKYGVKVIYQDTDSCALSLAKVAKILKKKYNGISDYELAKKIDAFCIKVISPVIDKGYEDLSNYLNCNTNKFVMKREKIANKAFWKAKKKYALSVLNDEGVTYSQPKLSVKGIETVRSDTPPKVREYLTKFITIMLNDPDNVKVYVKEVRDTFFSLPIEDIAKPSGVHGISKYTVKNGRDICAKGTPIHVRGSIAYNKYISEHPEIMKDYPLILEGNKIKFVYMKQPNMLFSHVLSFPHDFLLEIKFGKYVDYEKQFEVVFLNKIKEITDIAGIDIRLDSDKKEGLGHIFN
jgi:hypothetical protein